MAKKHPTSTQPTECDDQTPSGDDLNVDVKSASEQVDAARQQLEAAEALLEQARTQAVQHVAWLRDRSTGELIDTSLEFVRKHPGLSVAAAASVGYFVGRLFRR